MKYQLTVDYKVRFDKVDFCICCEAHFTGTFSSNALPRKGETIIVPISIKDSWQMAEVRNVIHSVTKGVLHHQVECDMREDLDNRVPRQADMDRLKEIFGDKIIPAAEKFGFLVIGLKFREEAIIR